MLFKNNKLKKNVIKNYKNYTKSILLISIILFSSINNNKIKITIYKINSDNSNINSKTIKINDLQLNFFEYRLYYSNIYNLIKITFSIKVFDVNNQLILPSYLSLKYNKHILCHINKNKRINIYSLALIEKDSYYKCIEFYHLNEKIKIGIFLYETQKESNTVGFNYMLFLMDTYLFKMKYKDDDIFNSTKIEYKYNLVLSQLENNSSLIEAKKLKKLYYFHPINTLKRNIMESKNKWNFLNIYNEFVCFCNGQDCLKFNNNKCKYYFYLYLIDLNYKTYKKTDYLLIDFILNRYSSDDVFPVFEKMIKRKINAHYITENRRIYKKYCKKKK